MILNHGTCLGIMAGLPRGHISLKGHLFKHGLVDTTVEMQTGI
jgi:hypothetical protein